MSKRIKVLLADDHTIVRKGLVALLSDTDMDVVGEAEDGKEALEKADALGPDVVVMDIGMPNLNGLEALRRLKKAHPEMRVLVLTMYSNEEYVRETLKAGASGYLVKRSAPRELISAIHAAMRGECFLSPSIAAGVVRDLVTRPESDLEPGLELGGSGLDRLTAREREVLQLVAEGYSNPRIAEKLCIGQKTVKTHRANLMEKLSLRNTAEVTRYAIRNGLVDLA